MSQRFLTLVLAGAVAVAAAVIPSAAPAQSPPFSDRKVEPPTPPAELPKVPRGDRTRNIEFLFGALKAAPDEASAKMIEDRIWALWLTSGGDTANLLMTRVKTAVEAENFDLALRLLDAMIEIRPQYAEAWNRRATVFFMKKDYGGALADLRQVLRREPRHFAALARIGAIMEDIGNEKAALDAYRKALAIHPHLKGVGDKINTLAVKVEGREI
jgi:tetratricopeptide (TPR) repeat protein